MATVDELRQILKEDQNGQNLYDHLTQTLMRILIERPKNAFETFERISADVKTNPMRPEESIPRALPPNAEQLNMQLEWARKCSTLLKAPDEPAEEASVRVQDLLADTAALDWAGVSLGRSLTYSLQLSMRKLAETLPSDVTSIRFFALIHTRTKPYFVVQGSTAEEIDPLDERTMEGKAGANKYSYWVTQSVESCQWTLLPHVTMKMIVCARLNVRLLTGDLEAAVPAYPPFPGVEKHLLRARLSCICGETSICPDGYFDLDTDSEPPVLKPAETEQLNERFPKPSNELMEVDNWKHFEVELNKLGRVNAMPEEVDESGEPVAPAEEVEVVPPLDSVKSELWSFRLAPGGAGTSPTSAVVARSLLWPGAVVVATQRSYVHLYVGDALSTSRLSTNAAAGTAGTYSPQLPPPLQSEWSMSGTTEGENEGGASLVKVLSEQNDVKVDPTPPVPEGEEPEE